MSAEADLVISRHIRAPRERVWEAWTECEQLKRWWGPTGYRATHCRIDLRVGGSFLVCLRSPDARELWSTGRYEEVVSRERLVATDSFADENGNVVPPARYGFGPDFPDELLLVVTLEEREGGTQLTLRHRGIPLGEDYGSTRIGWSQSLRKLADLLEPAARHSGRDLDSRDDSELLPAGASRQHGREHLPGQ
jgi:uncharacterized protein YndB with AHSA1/START domain